MNYDTVVDNPTFVLQLDSAATDLCVELSGPVKFPVGIELAPLPSAGDGGGGTAAAARGKPIVTSGSYRQGHCLLEAAALSAGHYMITACTFEPRQEGPFALIVSSSQPVAAGTLPHEGHGLQRQMYRSEWR